ncbi:expansin EXLX1 family cellulose-binding protein [Ralstonia solanacearum]|uniref:expansin EXLX1 family cellulose-binding protein n=1 Tax=Ralstonia solanacearum TaxID=305 RepID=UPI001B3B38E3|nr:expansin EXLX1 family cellulose-binding protein [Ralstonia solanacearum]AST31452.2 endoglucanase [Ralstonia solanacearum]MDB0508229.1 endoglucanase [Ralstonia solanacearum]MDB0513494.1 endoglucanase [Ralstonia solanacearum]MDB0565168.1 endoglucanase [Ralstonia solanacearum]MDB0574799.1 endoglucanase [Ralstonia solanacearum]
MSCFKKWQWIAIMLLMLSVLSARANGQTTAAGNVAAAQGSCLGTGKTSGTGTTTPANGWDSTFTGIATPTGSGYSGGAFLLDPIASDAEITALNPVQANLGGIRAAMAGAYLRVQGPKGCTTVYVTDLYPEAASGGLDLSYNAFSKIGDLKQGRIPIQWKLIAAPVTGNVVYRIKEGSTMWWAAIQVRNHTYPVVKLEVFQGKAWVSLPKADYNHFVGTQLGDKPLVIRITDIRGRILVDKLPPLLTDCTPKNANQASPCSKPYFVQGNVQFPE